MQHNLLNNSKKRIIVIFTFTLLTFSACQLWFLDDRMVLHERRPQRSLPTEHPYTLSSDRLEMLRRMRDEKNFWWTDRIKYYADRTGTIDAEYNDLGMWAALAYQITKDPFYIDQGWSAVLRTLVDRSTTYPDQTIGNTAVPTDVNILREHYIDFLLIYDMLYDGLNDIQRRRFLNALNQWADRILNREPFENQPDIRYSDSDQIIGFYFGLMGMDLLTAKENDHPLAGNFLHQDFFESDTNGIQNVGGLASTGTERNSMRNTIRQFAELAEGGVWFESGMYNQNTVVTLSLGVELARRVTGIDYFPEYTRLYEQFALMSIAEMVPELEQRFQWGDEQNPRYLLAGPYSANVGTVACLAGLTNSSVSSLSLGFLDDLFEAGNGNGDYHHRPYARIFFTFNPYSPARTADWRNHAPLFRYASGQGLLYVHDGWSSNNSTGNGSSFFGAHFAPSTMADHQQLAWGNFQLWRKGEWAVTHPIGYGPSTWGVATNSMLLYGLPGMLENREVVALEDGPNHDYAYIAGTNSGQWDNTAPTPYLDEWTRSFVYLPSNDNSCDSVIIADRVKFNNNAPPDSSDGYYSYPDWPVGGSRERMDLAISQGRPVEWRIHLPTSIPFAASDKTFNWKTEGFSTNGGSAQNIRLTNLLPNETIAYLNNEMILWAPAGMSPGDLEDNERKYHLILTPQAVYEKWYFFLSIVQAFDNGVTINCETVNTVPNTGSDVAGVVLQREEHNDQILVFSAEQNTRVLDTGYTISFTTDTSTSEILFFDLDSDKTWTITVNNSTRGLPVSEAGVSRFTISGNGLHTISIQ